MDGGERIFVVLWTPGQFPARAATGPSAKTNRRYLQIGVPKFPCFHLNPFAEARCVRPRLTLICCLSFSQNWMNKKREKLKLRRKKTERKDSVCRKSSVARSSFTIGIGHGDLLRAGSQRRNSNGQRVGVFESNGCWFSTFAANCEPNLSCAGEVKFWPLRIAEVPPAIGPSEGCTLGAAIMAGAVKEIVPGAAASRKLTPRFESTKKSCVSSASSIIKAAP